MLTKEQKEQFSEILETLGETLDITKPNMRPLLVVMGQLAIGWQTRIVSCSVYTNYSSTRLIHAWDND